VKVVPSSSVSLESSVIGENLCLFSSQFPSLLFLKELKLIEVHHECLVHAWLQVIKLEEPTAATVLIVWSVERLLSLTMTEADLKCF